MKLLIFGRRNFKELKYKGWKSQPSLKELYEHKCSCGKKIEDHNFPSGLGTTGHWDYAKIIYDLGTCNLEKRKIGSNPNGFGKFRDNYFIN